MGWIAAYFRKNGTKVSGYSRSSFIRGIDYSKADKKLAVQIRNKSYPFRNVPEGMANEFTNAESRGTFFNTYLKGNPKYAEFFISAKGKK